MKRKCAAALAAVMLAHAAPIWALDAVSALALNKEVKQALIDAGQKDLAAHTPRVNPVQTFDDAVSSCLGFIANFDLGLRMPSLGDLEGLLADMARRLLNRACQTATNQFNNAVIDAKNTVNGTVAGATGGIINGGTVNPPWAVPPPGTVHRLGSRVNTNIPITFGTDFGKNFNLPMSRNQSVSVQFTTPPTDWPTGSVIKEYGNQGSLVMTFANISAIQSDFTYPNFAAWNGCGNFGLVIALRYKVENVDSHTFGYCSLRPNTTYYFNIRNENSSASGLDTCASGASCGFLFQMH